MTFDLFSEQCLAAVKRGALGQLDSLVDWDRARKVVARADLKRGEAATGRPAYTNETLMRATVLRLLYLCSAGQATEALKTRLDWRWFCRLDVLAPTPEASTLARFWKALSDADVLHDLLKVVRQSAARRQLKVIPQRTHPTPTPRLRPGVDSAIWRVDGEEQGAADIY